MKEKLLNQRVVLNNPYGYDNYQGTVTRVYMIGNEEWADIGNHEDYEKANK